MHELVLAAIIGGFTAIAGGIITQYLSSRVEKEREIFRRNKDEELQQQKNFADFLTEAQKILQRPINPSFPIENSNSESRRRQLTNLELLSDKLATLRLSNGPDLVDIANDLYGICYSKVYEQYNVTPQEVVEITNDFVDACRDELELIRQETRSWLSRLIRWINELSHGSKF